MSQEQWLALNLGNSRLHGGVFVGKQLQISWDVPYDRAAEMVLGNFRRILIASVNPDRVTPWHFLPHSRLLTLTDVPLAGMYPTLGLDRALGAWGAIKRYGAPLLVIDCGTAITLTAIDGKGHFAGGAIFPGLDMLRHCLPQRIPHLPLVSVPDELPQLWAHNTPDALLSGIVHFTRAGLTKFITDREGLTLFTGGDGSYWHKFFPAAVYDPHLVFWGMAEL